MAKFDSKIVKTEQPKKVFTVPTPGLTTKPTVIIGKAALLAYKKLFISLPEQKQREDKDFIIDDTETSDPEIGRSRLFNQPIYSDITFNGGSYTDQNNVTQNFQSLNIELVLLTVGNVKNIVKTTLQGRNGTVKEYISDGDYSIKIEGKIFGKGINNYPQDDVQKLLNICLAPQSINVTSSFLKMFNIEDIVIESYNIDQQEGMRNCQPFTLNCVSDTPLILLKNA